MASMSSERDILLVGSSVNIVRRSAQTLTDLLRNRFGCDAVVSGLELDSDSSSVRRSAVVPEKRFETTLHSGVRVSVWRADLTNFSVEAVVNAANSQLQHYGGLALALSEAGGPQIQQDSNDYIKKHGNVKTGDAVVLDAGKLKCKKLIHAVGPQLSSNPNPHEVKAARPQLEKVIKSILDKVEKNCLETVAIPAISSGIFNYPLTDCAETIVATVVWYFQSPGSRFRPKEILFVNNDEPTVKAMELACGHILTPVKKTYSQATAPPALPPPALPPPALPPPAAAASKPTKGAKGTVDIGLVRVILRKGKLEEQQMDVIVNTAGTDRNLNYGAVSKALLGKAGLEMQKELKNASFSGSLIITNSYNLHCKQVYHTFCTGNSQGSHQMLFMSVQECLWFAAGSKHLSIAFPAIGTGALGFSNRGAAQVMWSAVWDFSLKCPVPLEVHFVIFPKDDLVFKAFEEELRTIQQKVAQMDPAQMFPGPGHSLHSRPVTHQPTEEQPDWLFEDKSLSQESQVSPRGPPLPKLSFRGPSEESVMEAERWLQRLLFNTFHTVVISNNFLQHFGEQQLKKLSRHTRDVQAEEFLERGHAGLIVSGNNDEDMAVAAVKIEDMLEEIQREFIREEEREMKTRTKGGVKFERKEVSLKNCPEIKLLLKPLLDQIRKEGLKIIKVEKVINPVLEKLFELQKKHLSSSVSQDMLQLVPAQFCDMVSHIGFRPECAPPDDALLGDGLYFAADVKTALRLWTERREEFLYLVFSEVLTGRSSGGKPGLLLPPLLGSDPTARFDSVDGPGVAVVFNQHQALPRFILTCKLNSPV